MRYSAILLIIASAFLSSAVAEHGHHAESLNTLQLEDSLDSMTYTDVTNEEEEEIKPMPFPKRFIPKPVPFKLPPRNPRPDLDPIPDYTPFPHPHIGPRPVPSPFPVRPRSPYRKAHRGKSIKKTVHTL